MIFYKSSLYHILFFECFFLINISIGQERLVRVNNQNFNVFTKGLEERDKDIPVLIFESGMGVDLGNWKHIIKEISNVLPVFTYERAGIGKSEKVYKMPSPKNVCENLHTILKELKIAPPYILVGHSLGGVFIRGFAGYYPEDIVGLAFIDPADFTETKNDWNDIFRKLGLTEQKISDLLDKRLYQASKIDSLRFGPWSEGEMLKELRKNDFLEFRDLRLPQVPIYFMVGGKFEVPVERRSKDFDQEAFFHIKNESNMNRWKKLIQTSSKGGSLIYLTNAGHYIHWDDPKAVISNLKLLIDQSLKK